MFDDVLGVEIETVRDDWCDVPAEEFCNEITRLYYKVEELHSIIEEREDEIENLENKIVWLELKRGGHIKSIKEAREFMFNTFIDDPDFLRAYVDNIAMLLYDEQNWSKGILDFKDKSTRDRIAANIMGIIFGHGAKPIVKDNKRS